MSILVKRYRLDVTVQWGADWALTPADEPIPDPDEAEDNLLALRLELVLTALDNLSETLRDLPQPQVFVDAPDLSAIVQAVNGLRPGADPDEIAQAVVRQIAPTAQKTPPDEVYPEIVKALEKLDFRLRGNLSGGSGLVSDVSDRATRVLGNVTVTNPTAATDVSALAKDATLTGGNAQVQGNAASGATDTGNPLKIGGKYTSAAPTPVTNGQRVDAWYDAFGRQTVVLQSAELNTSNQITSLRDLQTAQRYTVLADSVADGLAGFWTASTIGSGVAPTVTGGEGLLQSGAAASSSSQLTSTPVRYYPGQSTWLNSAVRFGDLGVVGNTRRVGVFTVSGTTPQDGYFYELADTTFSAVVVKAGAVVSSVPVGSWSRAAASPFTLDTNYHNYEIRFTANGVQFYIDNVVKHTYAGTTSAITTTLNFPMTLQSVNTTATTSCTLAVRNIGVGRFGQQPQDYSSASTLPTQPGANGVLTFTFPTPVDFVWVTDTSTGTSNISYVDAFGGTPAAGQGAVVLNQAPTPVQVVPPSSTVKVWAPSGAVIGMYGLRYV